MYVIKAIPEDFIVDENADHLLAGGDYSYYILKKRILTGDGAIDKLAQKWGLNKKWFNTAGNKDKQGITTQWLSIKDGPEKDLELPGIHLTFKGKAEERLALGDLKSNHFEITMRKLSQQPALSRHIPNYFDDQRFGIQKNNHLIGKALLKNDFKEACILLDLPTQDPIKQLVPQRRMLRLYIHAYQGFLFNELLRKHIEHSGQFNTLSYAAGTLSFPKEDNAVNNTLPLPGFGTEDKEAIALLKEDGLSPRSFIIRQIPGLSAEGTDREMFAPVNNLVVGKQELDDLNPGFKKQRLEFSLPKGSYATIVVKAMYGTTC
ncbi:MAG: tRNA pseudouridine(13) synthase TruD [Nanoarchaeota archaeon]